MTQAITEIRVPVEMMAAPYPRKKMMEIIKPICRVHGVRLDHFVGGYYKYNLQPQLKILHAQRHVIQHMLFDHNQQPGHIAETFKLRTDVVCDYWELGDNRPKQSIAHAIPKYTSHKIARGPIEMEQRARYKELRDKLVLPRPKELLSPSHELQGPSVPIAPRASGGIRARTGFAYEQRQKNRVTGQLAKGYTQAHKAKIIIKACAKKHKVRVNEIISQRRDERIVKARHEAMFRVTAKTSFSFTHIGKMFARDHSTILVSVRKYAKTHGLDLVR